MRQKNEWKRTLKTHKQHNNKNNITTNNDLSNSHKKIVKEILKKGSDAQTLTSWKWMNNM